MYQVPCKGCTSKYVEQTDNNLKIRITQHEAVVRNRYMSYLTALYCLDIGHRFPFEEEQAIGPAQNKAGRLFIEALKITHLYAIIV